MLAIQHYLKSGVEEGIIKRVPSTDVYWTPTITRDQLRERDRSESSVELRPIMARSDFLIGTYKDLDELRDEVRDDDPLGWGHSDIHHIVENHHLQYLGRVQAIDDNTYYKEEPCVVFLRRQHRLVIDNAVNDAEQVVFEASGFNFVREFRDAHRGKLSGKSRVEQTRMKMNWLKDQASKRKVNRLDLQRTIKDRLLELYSFTYQEADLRPLKLVARSVIGSMPV